MDPEQQPYSCNYKNSVNEFTTNHHQGDSITPKSFKQLDRFGVRTNEGLWPFTLVKSRCSSCAASLAVRVEAGLLVEMVQTGINDCFVDKLIKERAEREALEAAAEQARILEKAAKKALEVTEAALGMLPPQEPSN